MEETQTLSPPPENPPPPPPAAIDYSSNVDTSRAFRSVKEAVAIFGERFLTKEMIFLPSSSSKPYSFTSLSKQETLSSKSTDSSWKSCSSSCEITSEEERPEFLVTSLKKLESELEETKNELKLLKERESETKAVLASLNAEIHKNVSKITESAVAAVAVEVAEKAVASGGGGGERRREKRVKKKPIIPLVGDLFWKKKGKSNDSYLNPLYSSSKMNWI